MAGCARVGPSQCTADKIVVHENTLTLGVGTPPSLVVGAAAVTAVGALADAVLRALQVTCPLPDPLPSPSAAVHAMVKWVKEGIAVSKAAACARQVRSNTMSLRPSRAVQVQPSLLPRRVDVGFSESGFGAVIGRVPSMCVLAGTVDASTTPRGGQGREVACRGESARARFRARPGRVGGGRRTFVLDNAPPVSTAGGSS